MSVHALGIDVGGTKVAAGVVSWPDGQIIESTIRPTGEALGFGAVVELAEQLGRDRKIQAVGLGICELVDRSGAIVSDHCIKWIGQPIRERLSAIAPAVIEADVRAAALAESIWGAGRPFRIFLYITVGTGISSCLMIDGQPYLGATGATGTMASSAAAIPCANCGEVNALTLEQIASGTALGMRFGGRSGPEVAAAAASGDVEAVRIIKTAAEALGSQAALLVNTLDPEAVIFGGGLGTSEGLFWDGVVEATRRHIWSAAHRQIPIRRASTGTDAGWLGAAAAAINACSGRR